jgi:hypothetical protein
VSNTVTVACNLPQGLVAELGLEMDWATSSFRRTPAYKRVRLVGSQHATKLALPKRTQMVAQRDLPPGMTENVDREFIETWLRAHSRLAPHVWIVDKPADLKHQIGDRAAAPFQPVDGSKPMKFGLDEVSKASFDP